MPKPRRTKTASPGATTGSANMLRAAAQRRVNRQAAAVADVVRAWQALRKAEEESDNAQSDNTQSAMLALRKALENLEYEIEKS